jgi:hypothetical protein
VFGYIDVNERTECPPEVWPIPPATPCISFQIFAVRVTKRIVALLLRPVG